VARLERAVAESADDSTRGDLGRALAARRTELAILLERLKR